MSELVLLRNNVIRCDNAGQHTASLFTSISGIGNVADQLDNRTTQRLEVDQWFHNACRADLTPEAEDSWKIQLQLNNVAPSPTYASLTIQSSAVSYLTLNMPVIPINWPDDLGWNFIFTQQTQKRCKAKEIAERVNSFVTNINTLRPLLRNAMKDNGFIVQFRNISTNTIPAIMIPDSGAVPYNDITQRIDNIHKVYNSLRSTIRNFRGKVIPNRKQVLNFKIKQGLSKSLNFRCAYTLLCQ